MLVPVALTGASRSGLSLPWAAPQSDQCPGCQPSQHLLGRLRHFSSMACLAARLDVPVRMRVTVVPVLVTSWQSLAESRGPSLPCPAGVSRG